VIFDKLVANGKGRKKLDVRIQEENFLKGIKIGKKRCSFQNNSTN